MKTIYKISFRFLTCIMIALLMSGCSNFEEINTNPDGATAVTSGMLATNLILPLLSNSSTTHRFAKYTITTENNQSNMDVQFNNLGRSSVDNYGPLRNVQKMINFAPEGAYKNSYTALGHFIRAYTFFDKTMRLGDVPYSEALRGEENIFYPEYDAQKDIFIGILDELDEADNLFALGTKFDGDPYSYGGDPAKWRKMLNVFELRVLMNLYKRADDTPELKIRERLNKIVSERPLFASNDDNCTMYWNNIHMFGYFKGDDRGTTSRFVTSFIVDMLKQYNDYRLFYFVKPAAEKISAGVRANSFDAYVGVDITAEFSSISGGIDTRISRVNERYTERVEGEPTPILTSYVEQCFLIAEAISRGFITGDAKKYYEAGIRASMKYTADNTPDDERFHHNMKITDDYINGYLSSAAVAFPADMNDQIRQIITQKYMSGFLRSGELPWFDHRRTGYPAFPINPDTNRNVPSDKMPVRWMYTQSEIKAKTAIERQFGGVDDNNGIMWILK